MGGETKGRAFRGRYYLSIDSKGRVNVPAGFRDVLMDRYGDMRLVLATPFDRCLRAYPMEEWEKIEDSIATLPSTDARVKKYLRHFVASAVECECDKQGRVLLPQTHKEWAGINSGQIVFLGLVTRMELWDKASYDNEMQETDLSSVEVAITEFGGRI